MKRKHNPSVLLMFKTFVTIAIAASVLSGCNMQHRKDSQSTIEPITTTPTNVIEADVNTDTKYETPQSKAISSYQNLLQSFPAIEGEPEELNDMAFGYDENLAKFGNHYDYFAISDLNNDSIPELIAMTIINNRWTPVSIFTYYTNQDNNKESTSNDVNDNINQEIILLKDSLDPESHATFEQMSTASGAYDLYICKENHIHNVWSGNTPVGYQEENHAYILNGITLESVECRLGVGGKIDSNDIVIHFSDLANKNTEENRNVTPDCWKVS